MGGYGSNTCEQYDVNNNQLTTFAPLNEKKRLASAAVLDGKFIYLFGGRGIDNSVFDTIEKYDIVEDKQSWVIINLQLRRGLYRLASIAISPTEIFLFGGEDNDEYSTQTYIFNGQTNTIEESTKMPQAPEWLIPSAPVRIADTIYAQNKGNQLFSYHLKTKKWEQCEGMDIGGSYPTYGINLPKYIGAKYITSMSVINQQLSGLKRQKTM